MSMFLKDESRQNMRSPGISEALRCRGVVYGEV